MIDKRYIYQWLLLPLFACLTAGIVGCSNDMTESGKDEGASYLIINTRGINNTGTPEDEYVGRIRVLAFDDKGGLVCNELHTEFAVDTQKDEAIIKQEIKGHRGKIHLYLVANESWKDSDGYEVETDQPGNDYLPGELAKITNEADFKKLMLHYTPNVYIEGAVPFLMTGETVASLNGGNVSGNVELVRAFAKMTVNFSLEAGGDWPNTTITELKLESPRIPNTFNLIEDKVTGYSGTYYSGADFLEGTDTKIIDDASLSATNNTFSAYLPERILSENTEANAWKLSVKVNKKGRTLSGTVILNNEKTEGDGGINDHNIYRNTEYAVDASIPNAEALKLTVSASEWTNASKDIEWSNDTEFTLDMSTNQGPEVVTDGDTKYYPIFHSAGDGSQAGVVHCKFQLTKPTGVEWAASLSDALNFEFSGFSSGIGGQEATFQIIAKEPLGNLSHRDLKLVIRYRETDGNWKKLLIDSKGDTSGATPEEILIRQIAPSSN